MFLFESDLIGRAKGKPKATGKDSSSEASLDDFELLGLINWASVHIFRRMRGKFRICTKSGSIIKIDPSLFWYSWEPEFGDWPSPDEFFPDEYEERKKWSNMNFEVMDNDYYTIRLDLPHYLSVISPLRGFPLCIRESDLPVPLEELPSWLFREVSQSKEEGQSGATPTASRSVAQQIVDLFEQRKVRTKPEAKRILGPHSPSNQLIFLS